MKIPAALPLVISFMSGGLAGAVFNWWIHLPVPTVLTYKFATTKDTPNPQNQQTGDVFVHTVQFSVKGGPVLDHADISLRFPDQTRLFGTAPDLNGDPLHDVSCTQTDKSGAEIPSGLRCTLTTLSPGFDFTIATHATTRADPMLDGERINPQLSLIPLEQYLKEQSSHSVGHDLLYWFVPGLIVSLLACLTWQRLASPSRIR